MVMLVWKAVVYTVLMNAVPVPGACVAGTDHSFNFIFNVLTPVLCAFAAREVEQGKARREAHHE